MSAGVEVDVGEGESDSLSGRAVDLVEAEDVVGVHARVGRRQQAPRVPGVDRLTARVRRQRPHSVHSYTHRHTAYTHTHIHTHGVPTPYARVPTPYTATHMEYTTRIRRLRHRWVRRRTKSPIRDEQVLLHLSHGQTVPVMMMTCCLRAARFRSSLATRDEGRGRPPPTLTPSTATRRARRAQARPVLGPRSRKPFPKIKIYHYTPG